MKTDEINISLVSKTQLDSHVHDIPKQVNDVIKNVEISVHLEQDNIFGDSSRKEKLERNVELNEVENQKPQINLFHAVINRKSYVELYQFTHAFDTFKCVIAHQTHEVVKQPIKVDRALRKAGFSITILMMNWKKRKKKKKCF